MDKACYRNLHRYKYQLMNPYSLNVDIEGYWLESSYLKLDEEGTLEIKKGYAWDGPSGPTIDTLNFMRGALVHDALYQLIRMEVMSISYKEHADKLLRSICKEDGMSSFRAWYVYKAVQWFGNSSATPGTNKPDKITCVPAQ